MHTQQNYAVADVRLLRRASRLPRGCRLSGPRGTARLGADYRWTATESPDSSARTPRPTTRSMYVGFVVRRCFLYSQPRRRNRRIWIWCRQDCTRAPGGAAWPIQRTSVAGSSAHANRSRVQFTNSRRCLAFTPRRLATSVAPPLTSTNRGNNEPITGWNSPGSFLRHLDI